MPVDIIYEGQKVTVDNKTTLYLDDIREIPANKLFVSEPSGPDKKRYAFSIEELNKHISMGGIHNYYSHDPFTLTDIRKLSAMSPALAEYFNTMANFPLNTINEKTLNEIQNFADNAGYLKETEFAREVMERRKADIENLKGIASPADIIRGEAFTRFKDYYMNLPAAEKAAIHNFPGIKEMIQTRYSLDSIEDLFNLPHESCLGGTAGVCTFILESLAQAKDLQTALAKQQNNSANPAKPKAASHETTLSSEQQKIKDDYIKFVDELKNTRGNRTQKRSAGFILKNLESAFQACNTAANNNDRDQAYRTLAIEVAAAKKIAKTSLGIISDQQPTARISNTAPNRVEERKQQFAKLAPPPKLVLPPKPLLTKPAAPGAAVATQTPAQPATTNKKAAAVVPPPTINIHKAMLSPKIAATSAQRPQSVAEIAPKAVEAAPAPPAPPPRQVSLAANKTDDAIKYTPKHSTHDSDTSWMKSPYGNNLNKLGQEVAFVIAKLTATKGYTAIDLSAITLTDSPLRENMVNDLLSKFPNSQKELLKKCFGWQKQIDDMIAGIKEQKNPDPEIPVKMNNMMQEMRKTFSENITKKKSSLFVNEEHNTLMARAAAGVTNVQKSMSAAEKPKNVIENIVDKVFSRKP